MKKILILLVLSGLFIGNVCAKDDFGPNRRLKSGVWLKLGYDATSKSFLCSEGVTANDKQAQFGLNFQLGTTFYIGPRIADMLRFGLDASWLDLNYFKLNDDRYNNGSNYFLNFFEVGPIVSFSPVSQIAFDAYFRVVPSLSYMYFENSILGNTEDFNYLGYNTNSLLGVTFRASVFSVGVEYKFGKMKYTYLDDDEYGYDTDKLNTGMLRVLIGFKF